MRSTVVRIWGLAIDGKIFHQNANFRSLSRTGAQIEGVFQPVALRDMIGLQYERKRARVFVSSIDSREPKNIILGVDLSLGEPCPWEALLDPQEGEVPGSNRRRYKRHSVELPVELRHVDSEVSVRVLATDVCGNGCYLQTMATAPVGSDRWSGLFLHRSSRVKLRTSPHHRFLIALHSPTALLETGLRMYPLEKRRVRSSFADDQSVL
jgi:hypothetical protein